MWNLIWHPRRTLAEVYQQRLEADPNRFGVAVTHVTAALREIGILLVALSPVDVVINKRDFWIGAEFVDIGVIVYAGALLITLLRADKEGPHG